MLALLRSFAPSFCRGVLPPHPQQTLAGRARGFLVRPVFGGSSPGGVELGALRSLRQESAFRKVALLQR